MLSQNLQNIQFIDGLIIFCHIVVICFYLIPGAFLLHKLRDKPKEIRYYLMGIALFFLLYGTARLIMFIFELTFNPFVWRIDVNEFNKIFEENPELELRHDVIWRFTTGIGTVGYFILMYQLESHILEKKTKFIFSALIILTVIPSLIFGVSGKDDITIVRIILYIGNFMVIVIPLSYLYFALKTAGETRRRAIGAAVGMVVLFSGVVFNSSFGKSLFNNMFGLPGLYLTYYLYAICTIIGCVVYLKSLRF